MFHPVHRRNVVYRRRYQLYCFQHTRHFVRRSRLEPHRSGIPPSRFTIYTVSMLSALLILFPKYLRRVCTTVRSRTLRKGSCNCVTLHKATHNIRNAANPELRSKHVSHILQVRCFVKIIPSLAPSHQNYMIFAVLRILSFTSHADLFQICQTLDVPLKDI